MITCLFFKPGFYAVLYYKGTMPRFVRAKNMFHWNNFLRILIICVSFLSQKSYPLTPLAEI